MATKKDFTIWIKEALIANNGSASIRQISKYIWDNYSLINSKLYFIWRYKVHEKKI